MGQWLRASMVVKNTCRGLELCSQDPGQMGSGTFFWLLDMRAHTCTHGEGQLKINLKMSKLCFPMVLFT